ncbi:DUF1828 domain-containing protein [Saccharomonospora xinjiangensis]|uniref:DUF1828 domain-containing protein n=1 Tax=Saccharomonospora xinjiangensis TaxID=75294 RepID=UPI00106F214C|nr:DUF1828 domain-containing protein [Saccharomonospora xinjiangensis]QBQ61453.1 hypothetical protein EYD13_15525 [Saccharomonospora xinjiangensis]
MDEKKIAPALLSYVNDDVVVTPYGHGHLVTTPMRFYDDDRVTLFVERYEGGVRVTDQGTTAMRLHMADVNIDSPSVSEAWRRSVAALGSDSIAAEEGIIAAWGDDERLGRLVFAVAEAVLRIDQLRWLAPANRPIPFRDRVVSRLIDIAGSHGKVTPRAPLPQKSGRVRQVTAAVGDHETNRVYVQAVTPGDGGRAVEHCYYLFSHTDVPRERTLAVASGSRGSWPDDLVNELDDVTEVAFYDQPGQVRSMLTTRLAAVE